MKQLSKREAEAARMSFYKVLKDKRVKPKRFWMLRYVVETGE